MIKTAVQTVPRVELPLYCGWWYEQARLDVWFQRGCTHTTAEYQILPSGGISVVNRCVDSYGRHKEARADAKATDSTNSKLKVRFSVFWPWAGDYWILYLGPVVRGQYSSAVVGSPNRKTLWILSREPRLSNKEFAMAVYSAYRQGFDVDKLILADPTRLSWQRDTHEQVGQ